MKRFSLGHLVVWSPLIVVPFFGGFHRGAGDVSPSRFRPETPCGQPAAFFPYPLPMIAKPPLPSGGYNPPVDVFARFAVSLAGTVDTASLEMYPPPGPAMRAVATTAMAGWQLGSIARTAAQLVCGTIRFADTTGDGDPGARPAGLASEWVPRADGFVEHWHPAASVYGRDVPSGSDWVKSNSGYAYDAYRASDVLKWLDRFQQLRDSATRTRNARLPFYRSGDGPWTVTALASPWYAALGARAGTQLIGSVVGTRDSEGTGGIATRRLSLQIAPCGGAIRVGDRFDASVDSSLMAIRAAAQEAFRRQPEPIVDTTRRYSELEVNCPATRRGNPMTMLVTDDSIRTALVLPRDAVVGFVVDRNGHIDSNAVHLFGGAWMPAQRQRIITAITHLTYYPATFAGFHVAQYQHYVITAGSLTASRVGDTIHALCASRPNVGIDLRVLSPAKGTARAALQQIGDSIAKVLNPLTTASSVAGVFRFVVTQDGRPSFLTWISPTSDTIGLRDMLWDSLSIALTAADSARRLGPLGESRKVLPVPPSVGPHPFLPAMGLEVTVRKKCP